MKLRYHSVYPLRRSAVPARNVVATSQPLDAQAGLGLFEPAIAYAQDGFLVCS